MHTLDTRVATGVFDPGNPSQRTEVYYAGWPGQYASFYTNGLPNEATVNLGRARARLMGPGLGGFASWSPVAQVATIGALAIATYFATKKLRTKGLLGGHRRRRRR